MSEPKKVKISLVAEATARTVYSNGRKRKVYDAQIGAHEFVCAHEREIVEKAERHARAMLLAPAPQYRRLPDGRALIARVVGADDDGYLCYALERFHDDGRSAGAELGVLRPERTAWSGIPHASLQSEPAAVDQALKRLIDAEVARHVTSG